MLISLITVLAFAICNPEAGARTSTPAQKAAVRTEAGRVCELAGAAPIVCALVKVIVARESWGGEEAAVCTKGHDRDGTPELGYGPMCLAARWHGDKWPGPATDYCDVAVSTVVTLEIFHRAVTRWHAVDAAGLQAVFAHGLGECGVLVEGELLDWKPPSSWRWSKRPVVRWLYRWTSAQYTCRPPLTRHRDRLCARLSAHGHSCTTRITAKSIGRRFSSSGARAAWVAAQRAL